MKKPKIWIRVFFHALLYITFETSSGEITSFMEENVAIIAELKHNIPRDYNISVEFLPKEVSDMCWVNLNMFHLEEGLKQLALKFGNISSNRDNIGVLIQILKDLRFNKGQYLNTIMEEFQCHYRKETLVTGKFFNYVQQLLQAARSHTGVPDCESPPCPTTANPPMTEDLLSISTRVTGCSGVGPNCNARQEKQTFPPLLQTTLISTLMLPVAAVALCIVWKMNARRRGSPSSDNEDIRVGTTVPLQETPGQKSAFAIREV